MRRTNCRGAVLYWIGKGSPTTSGELEVVLAKEYRTVEDPEKEDVVVWDAGEDAPMRLRDAGIITSSYGPKIRSKLGVNGSFVLCTKMM